MLPYAIVGLVIVLAVAACSVQRGSTTLRPRLLRTGVASMVAVITASQLIPMVDHPGTLDIFRRLASLVMQASVILLVLTFGRHGPTRSTRTRIWSVTLILAVAEMVLGAIVYTVGRGVRQHTGTWTDHAVFAFHAVHASAFLITACVVGGACGMTMLKPRQLMTARLSMLLTLCAAVSAGTYIILEFIGLTSPTVFTHSALQQGTIFVTIALLISAVILGLIHPAAATLQRTSVEHLTIDLIEPLWRAVTSLHPEVVLTHHGLTTQEKLLRLIIESHDALGLIRRDCDPALLPVRRTHPEEPHLTAALLLHLLGEQALDQRPDRLAAWFIIWSNSHSNDVFKGSVQELYKVRLACADRRLWWQPIPVA